MREKRTADDDSPEAKTASELESNLKRAFGLQDDGQGRFKELLDRLREAEAE